MSYQMIFFEKAASDFETGVVTVTASQGADYEQLMLNRSNKSGWVTSGSVDADLTNFVVDMVDVMTITDILLLKHNFKSFTIQYWNDSGGVWTDFSTAIAPTTNTAASNHYYVGTVTTSKIKVVINGTQTVNDDKYLFQFIATQRIGQLDGWPVIKKPIIGRDRKLSKMLSGKNNQFENAGFYSASLEVANWKDDSDMDIVEALYNSNQGFLFWPCGGSESQFSSVRMGYRMEDIYLCRCINEFNPEWYKGLYSSGMKIKIDLAEVVT